MGEVVIVNPPGIVRVGIGFESSEELKRDQLVEKVVRKGW